MLSIERNRTKNKSNPIESISIGSEIEHNRTGTFRDNRTYRTKSKRLVRLTNRDIFQIFVHNRQCFTLAGMRLTLQLFPSAVKAQAPVLVVNGKADRGHRQFIP